MSTDVGCAVAVSRSYGISSNEQGFRDFCLTRCTPRKIAILKDSQGFSKSRKSQLHDQLYDSKRFRDLSRKA